MKDFDAQAFIERLKKIQGIQLDPLRITAYRGQPAQVGMILADSLHLWHSPFQVSEAFRSITNGAHFYTSAQIEQISLLWQVRHSIVHTGSTLTLPDAEKHHLLRPFAGKSFVFKANFIGVLAQKMHSFLKESVGRFSRDYKNDLIENLDKKVASEINTLFLVTSKMKGTWLQ